jgi:hypothetical protein
MDFLDKHLPKRLPQGADVGLPSSGLAQIPQEKLLELFPELSEFIDRGWIAFVDQNGELIWYFPPAHMGVCPACGQQGNLISEEAVPISNWSCNITDFWRCPACGHEWWHEWRM